MPTEIAGAELQFLKAVDRAATIREAYIKALATAVAGGVDFWDLADASANLTYENWCNVWDVSECDDLLAAGGQGDSSGFAQWFSAHTSWITTSASAARPGLGCASWQAYFGLLTNSDADLGKFWRVPWQFAELYYDRFRRRLGGINVGAKGILSATIGDNVGSALHDFGSLERSRSPAPWVAGDGDLNTALTVGAPLLYNCETSAVDLTGVAITAKKISSAGAAGTKAFTGLAISGNANDSGKIGEIAITTGPSAGQKVILSTSVPAAAVAAGDYVLIWESDVLHEIAEVASMTTSTSLTLAKNLVHTYTTNAKVWPLYTGISGTPSASGGTTGKRISLYARPDRIITLGS